MNIRILICFITPFIFSNCTEEEEASDKNHREKTEESINKTKQNLNKSKY